VSVATVSGLARRRRVLWILVWVSIGLWVFHLTFSAAVVHVTCSDPGWRWSLYAVTPLAAVPALLASLVALRVVRETELDDDAGPSEEDQIAFLSRVTLFVAVINLVLIVAEGIVVPFVSSCA
jgi:hypothetical protein